MIHTLFLREKDAGGHPERVDAGGSRVLLDRLPEEESGLGPQRPLAVASAAVTKQGDSRGPLVCDLTNAWVLVGLASWGLDCQHPIYRSIFTNVSYFIDWMDEIQRLTPLPDAMSVPPQTQFPHQPLQAAGSPGPGTGFVPPQPWPLLLFLLQAPRQALW
ncbi:putative serine protease 47 isoform X3 [Camelus dromedarius]|uniref:putative serine protease 47 isoform X3 n=1 Tax=Camelus dromedarius TaxID=9838 RepID=UPI0031195E05